VTDPGKVLLDRAQLERAFTALGTAWYAGACTAASPRHIFAMKALAARTRDIDDLRLLAEMIGVDSAATAVQICAEFFPEEDIPPRSAAVLQELFG
jgi:hypothetical protein